MTGFVLERVNKGSYVQLLIITYTTLYCHLSVRDQIKFLAMQICIIVVEVAKMEDMFALFHHTNPQSRCPQVITHLKVE